MGSGRRIQLLLVELVALSCLTSGARPVKVMSAPNMLRAGATENIFIEIQDSTHRDNVDVRVSVRSYPNKDKILFSTSVILTRAKQYQDFVKIKIPTEEFSKDPDVKQYVYLQAQFPDQVLERVVLVSFQSGYIFIQTDKPIYTPDSPVNYRAFGLTPGMDPVESEDRSENDVTIEILTPEGITISSDVKSFNSGTVHGTYNLHNVVSFGMWKVVAKFQSNPHQAFTAEFEVKEYVLPSFEVKLTPSSSAFYVDSESLTVNIEATYISGKEVDGTAYAVFGVMEYGNKRSFLNSTQRVAIQGGVGFVQLMKDHITQTFPNINDLLGSSIYVAVSVLTESGGEMVEAEITAAKIVTSPYTIHFRRTPKYFKQGMPHDVTVEVVNPDGSPAPDVAVAVDPGNVAGRTSAEGVARVTINTAERPEIMSITARTNNPLLQPQRQASASMTAHSYKTTSKNYLLISVDKTEVELGENLRVKLFLSRPESQEIDLTYLILSRGQLVKYGRYQMSGQVIISLTLPITKELLPSFRIVAYYHPNSDEVVSDSVWVDVKDSCMGSLKLEIERPLPSYEPRKVFRLRVTGDPGATVGLVAVDKSAYVLNNKLHLTQKKIWDTVEKFDTGCTPGGGKDSMGVFYDAGLLFETSNHLGTPDRTDVKCLYSSRRKRSSSVTNFRTRLVSHYEGRGQRECCLDGMRNISGSYTCERRSEYIMDGPACIEAFRRCCKEMERKRVQKEGTDLPARRKRQAPGDDDDYIETDEMIIRSFFYESWYWMTEQLNPCPPENPNCKSTSLERMIPLPDTHTTWKLSGISLSRTHGICVSDPLEVIVRKYVFIDLRLPHTAVRGEQLKIKAIINNYSPDPVTVRVELKEESNLCSTAYRRGWYRQEVRVGAQTSRSVPFIIIPMKEGKIPVEVKAVVRDSLYSDGISKMLKVKPPGKLVKSVKTVILNLAQSGQQVTTINSEIPRRDVAPNSPLTTVVSVAAGEMNAQLKAVISGDSMDALIVEPSGSGEKNMILMTRPVIATTYLDQTNQWDVLGFNKRNVALQHIKKGYLNELAYRKPDGSFFGITRDRGNTWLTAYVVKVFSMAQSLVPVDQTVICDAVKFIILNAQQPDGKFTEIGRMFHTEMTGDVTGTDSDASMTAFCLIALQESRRICSISVNMMSRSINQAVTYLEQRLPHLTNPYAVAMASYALATENKLNKEILYKFAAPDRFYWPVQKGHVYTLEATAYALLALVKAEAFVEAKSVVKWLIHQPRWSGGFGSIQATITVYQALGEYWTKLKDPEYNLQVIILLPGRSTPDKYQFNKENQHITRTSKFGDINSDVAVTATGTGTAYLKMESFYYTLPTAETDCDKFSLTVQVLPALISDNEKVYQLKIEVLYKDNTRDATMSILDVGLPTGFTPNKNDLDSLSAGRDRIISGYGLDQSQRSSLIISLNKISNLRPEEITFRIHQQMTVGMLQPAAVSVYEYNDKKPCVKFYHPQRSEALMQLCRGNECVCAEENCSQLKINVGNNERSEKSCQDRGTFVYKVRSETFSEDLSTNVYSMRILSVVKEVSVDENPGGKLRTFLSPKRCKDALGLKANGMYLIMGSSGDIHQDGERFVAPETSRNYFLEELQAARTLTREVTTEWVNVYALYCCFQYIFIEGTWIEYWPTDAECQTEQHRPVCRGMEELVQQHEIFGCQQK